MLTIKFQENVKKVIQAAFAPCLEISNTALKMISLKFHCIHETLARRENKVHGTPLSASKYATSQIALLAIVKILFSMIFRLSCHSNKNIN